MKGLFDERCLDLAMAMVGDLSPTKEELHALAEQFQDAIEDFARGRSEPFAPGWLKLDVDACAARITAPWRAGKSVLHTHKRRHRRKSVNACPCEHIRDYYNFLWQADHQLGTNLLRRGYYQASRGIWHPENNLFEPPAPVERFDDDTRDGTANGAK